MNRIFSLLLLVVVSLHGFGATEKETGKVPLDTILARNAERIADMLDNPATYEEAGKLIKKSLAMEGAKESKIYPILRVHQGFYHFVKGDLASQKAILLELWGMMPVEIQPDVSINVAQSLAVIYRREGKMDSAFYYYDRALEAAQEQHDMEWMVALHHNIGVLHHSLGQMEEAEVFLDRAMNDLEQTEDPYMEMCTLQMRAAVKIALDKLDVADKDIHAAWALAQESEMPDWQLRCITTMLTLFDMREQLDSARAYIQEGNGILATLSRNSVASVGYVSARAYHYYMEGDWARALADYQENNKIEMGGVNTRKVYENMARCCEHLGRYREAYQYLDSALVRADTLASENLAKQLSEFNVKYQTVEKDLAISRLQTQRMWAAIAIGVILLAAALSVLWWRLWRARREAQLRIDTLEQERQRLAKELHDGLCNDMLALEMQMQMAEPQTSPLVQERLHELREQARQISHRLMPPEFTYLNLNQLLKLYATAMAKSLHVDITYSAIPADDDTWKEVNEATASNVYRIAQEQIANIVKGRTATEITISLSTLAGEGYHYQLSITDNGHPADQGQSTGLGNRTLKDRLTSIAARLHTSHEETGNRFVLDFN
ncbi:MAG: tetratricopeptide repeat protein [Prevotella sp.]|nr:tetratricopeptide repeat protein [Prevotella sp.]